MGYTLHGHVIMMYYFAEVSLIAKQKRRKLGIPMAMNGVALVVNMFLVCYERGSVHVLKCFLVKICFLKSQKLQKTLEELD